MCIKACFRKPTDVSCQKSSVTVRSSSLYGDKTSFKTTFFCLALSISNAISAEPFFWANDKQIQQKKPKKQTKKSVSSVEMHVWLLLELMLHWDEEQKTTEIKKTQAQNSLLSYEFFHIDVYNVITMLTMHSNQTPRFLNLSWMFSDGEISVGTSQLADAFRFVYFFFFFTLCVISFPFLQRHTSWNSSIK